MRISDWSSDVCSSDLVMRSMTLALLLLITASAHAQLHSVTRNPLLDQLAFAPPLGMTLALHQPLRDADGQRQRLAAFFAGHMPVAMPFGYYQSQRLDRKSVV